MSYVSPSTVSIPARDLLVIGAGASGLMCAMVAGRRGLSVTLADAAARPGGKIAVSGGGKANFTNLHITPEQYVGADTAFCAPALERCTPQDMLNYADRHGIPWEEREHGRIFCRVSARRLIEALVKDCARAGCVMLAKRAVTAVRATDALFTADTDLGPLTARHLVIAAGSPAWPQAGATDGGLRLARSLGHSVAPVRPVLVPLNMPREWALHGLEGISLAVRIRVRDHVFADHLLFTHQGISGPAALLASCRWEPGTALEIDFLPERRFSELLDAPECGKLLVRSLLSRHMARRLADKLLPPELAARKVAELSRAARTLLHATVHAHTVTPTGTCGLRRAEAAAGGVATREVDARTMESRRCPRLYLTGEVLDVAGYLGGYNLHWAWASGKAAGESVGA